jgi:uncharacterized protein
VRRTGRPAACGSTAARLPLPWRLALDCAIVGQSKETTVVRTATQPLTPAPLAEAADAVIEDTADALDRDQREVLSHVEGLLTAAAIGPERTYPHEWVNALLDRDEAFEDIVMAQAFVTLLAQIYNDVVDDLERSGADYAPIFFDHAEEGEEFELAQHWADGFVEGIRLRRKAWGTLADTHLAGCLGCIGAFVSAGVALDEPDAELAQARQEALPRLGISVFAISEYWKTHARKLEPARNRPYRKTGRNEPCPCGSGKKYKKCCLDRAE